MARTKMYLCKLYNMYCQKYVIITYLKIALSRRWGGGLCEHDGSESNYLIII